jgi:hypothetical protein
LSFPQGICFFSCLSDCAFDSSGLPWETKKKECKRAARAFLSQTARFEDGSRRFGDAKCAELAVGGGVRRDDGGGCDGARLQPVAAGGAESGYRVLKPIESGDLTLFPVVRADGKTLPADQLLTLDEGLKSGEIQVTEAGRVRGLVRSRGGATPMRYQGDQ